VKTILLKIDPLHPEKAMLERAAVILAQDGVVAMPTDTVYGLAGSAFSREAHRKIYRLKGRSYRKPLIVMPPDIRSLGCIAEVSPDARKLMHAFWPGPLTLILHATPLGKMVMGGRADLGARIPDHRVVRSLLDLFGCPLITTSANPSSKPSARSGSDAVKYFDGKVDCIIDAGPAAIGRESTVIDMLKFPYVVIREGCLHSKELLNYL
jgi:L-threonylcarbamoyladenylate synthase